MKSIQSGNLHQKSYYGGISFNELPIESDEAQKIAHCPDRLRNRPLLDGLDLRSDRLHTFVGYQMAKVFNLGLCKKTLREF